MNPTKTAIIVVVIALLALVLRASLYTVDERETVIITFAGKAVDQVDTAGLHVKGPFFWKIVRIPDWILEWDGYPSEIPTKDKRYIYVDTFARWKVADPLLFFESVQNERGAQARLDDIIDGATRDYVSSENLLEVVRDTNRELLRETEGYGQTQDDTEVLVGRRELARRIHAKASPQTLEKYGIELLDVKIKRINYVEQVREDVYERMISERQRIAELYRSQGRESAEKIAGERERELKKITSEAYKAAQEIRGDADAEATRIYAEAFNQDPDYYQFLRTLESYPTTLKSGDTMILSTDAEYFKYLKQYK